MAERLPPDASSTTQLMSTCRTLRHTLCSIRIQRVYATCIVIACACSVSYANRYGYMQREFDGAAWNDIALDDTHISDPIGRPGRSVVLHHTHDAGAVLLSMILIGDMILLVCLLSRAYRSSVAVMRTLYSAIVVVVSASVLVLPPPHNGTFNLTLFATTATIVDLHSTFRTVALWEAMTPNGHIWLKVPATLGYIMSQTSSCMSMHTYSGCIVLGFIMAAFICTAVHPPPVDRIDLVRRAPPVVRPYDGDQESVSEFREANREMRRVIWEREESDFNVGRVDTPIDNTFEEWKRMRTRASRAPEYEQLSTSIPPEIPAHELVVSPAFNKAINDISHGVNEKPPPPRRDLSISVEDDEMP